MTCGYRVFVCSNIAFAGDFTPVLAKHSKSFSLIDCISVSVDRMQRNFQPMRKQAEAWRGSELTDVTAKVVIYEAFVEAKLEAPKHLARTVHDLYLEPKYDEFRPGTMWRLSNAFTSAFKELISRMHSLPRSRNWIPSRNSKPQRNWESFSRLGSRRHSSLRRYRPGRRFDHRRCLRVVAVIIPRYESLALPDGFSRNSSDSAIPVTSYKFLKAMAVPGPSFHRMQGREKST